MADWKQVDVNPEGEAVEFVVEAKTPQLIGGRLWRYTDAKEPDGLAGKFDSLSKNTVSLGNPAEIIDKRFLLVGTVVHQNDDPPTPYRVDVSVKQGEKEILSPTVPPDQGEGRIGNSNKGFTYHFVVRREP